MRIQELRIGNLVECFGICEVISIYENKIKVRRLSDSGERFVIEKVPIDSLSLKPIKITTEILIQLGFEKCNGWDDIEFWREKEWEKQAGEYFDLVEMDDGFEQPSCAKCEFVHQLQNSYYQHWLNGTELSTKNLLEKCKS